MGIRLHRFISPFAGTGFQMMIRKMLFALSAALLLTGCGSEPTEVLDVPEDNPYQATPEEIAAYNEDKAEEAAAMRPGN